MASLLLHLKNKKTQLIAALLALVTTISICLYVFSGQTSIEIRNESGARIDLINIHANDDLIWHGSINSNRSKKIRFSPKEEGVLSLSYFWDGKETPLQEIIYITPNLPTRYDLVFDKEGDVDIRLQN